MDRAVRGRLEDLRQAGRPGHAMWGSHNQQKRGKARLFRAQTWSSESKLTKIGSQWYTTQQYATVDTQ
ncbi:hypothetical protein L917_01606 [Phytophthora nicotianae]|uniref:Uncharacterized protein n=4 Tax=Phytophthora nicotianae TaxID=4792 RepID=W2QSZ8_PHYN3|nr:hypothetical protein PPTG_21972 [Phytophthora nicotianae INRA-310]ETI55574.1 hypothetical protein F443_01748 [Phytophthora nicotianae P1569]ETK95404.1 hypothetical protein L915_01667 [Phytophthora nicotianae]ETO84335.1 hypothetical protein F444_01749 [Phytophthora nicotianae P1976]ETL48791.1 hypothetical protein L916_01642 [Phytophthora nicotianae]ETM01850.1 hypothetical protein L917_01606 [Phytophthora nicotianae]